MTSPPRVRWLLALLGLLAGCGLARCEGPDPLAAPAAPPPCNENPLAPAAAAGPATDCDGRVWFGADYLLWWVKNGPVATPLVTTGSPGVIGTGQPGVNSTRVLFGDHDLDYGSLSGARMSAGLWLDDERTFGVESSAFWLAQKTLRFSAASDANGNPVLALPTINPNGSSNAFYVAAPVGNSIGAGGSTIGPFAGGVVVSSSTRLWGSDINAVWNVARRDGFALDALVGFRYLDLEENLQDSVATNGIGFDAPVLGTDRFGTRNQFYGGQLGGRFVYRSGAFSLSATGLLGLGATTQANNVNGLTIVSGADAIQPGTFPGFVSAQPTNMGHHSHDDFSVVPQLQIKGGYELFSGVRLVLGYDFLYWTRVLRPGNQIDPVVNVSQTSPDSFGGNLQLVGPARPMPLARASDFWAQGLSVGVEFRW